MDKLIGKMLRALARKYANYQELKKELRQIKYGKEGKKKKLTTTKFLTFFLFINMTAVEIFALYMTYIMRDLSVLPVLITPIIGEVMALAVYSIKSTKENISGGIVYELALKNESQNNDAVG